MPARKGCCTNCTGGICITSDSPNAVTTCANCSEAASKIYVFDFVSATWPELAESGRVKLYNGTVTNDYGELPPHIADPGGCVWQSQQFTVNRSGTNGRYQWQMTVGTAGATTIALVFISGTDHVGALSYTASGFACNCRKGFTLGDGDSEEVPADICVKPWFETCCCNCWVVEWDGLGYHDPDYPTQPNDACICPNAAAIDGTTCSWGVIAPATTFALYGVNNYGETISCGVGGVRGCLWSRTISGGDPADGNYSYASYLNLITLELYYSGDSELFLDVTIVPGPGPNFGSGTNNVSYFARYKSADPVDCATSPVELVLQSAYVNVCTSYYPEYVDCCTDLSDNFWDAENIFPADVQVRTSNCGLVCHAVGEEVPGCFWHAVHMGPTTVTGCDPPVFIEDYGWEAAASSCKSGCRCDPDIALACDFYDRYGFPADGGDFLLIDCVNN